MSNHVHRPLNRMSALPSIVVLLSLTASIFAEDRSLLVPLAEVSQLALGTEPPPVATAFEKYRGKLVAIEGVLQGKGVPAGLGTHHYVNLHAPEDPAKVSLIHLVGIVPKARSKRCRIIGTIVRKNGKYAINVRSWELLDTEETGEGKDGE